MSHTKQFLETVSEETGRKGQVTPNVIKYAISLIKINVWYNKQTKGVIT